MDGKYVGNRPIKLSKIKDDLYGKIDTVSVSGRKVCLFSSFPPYPYLFPLLNPSPSSLIPLHPFPRSSTLLSLHSALSGLGTRESGIQRVMES